MNLGEDDPINLCFEVHGEDDAYFNLVSDACVSVNAHYIRVRPEDNINIIDSIHVRAVDSNGACRNIDVSLNQCGASVDGVSVDMYNSAGISVRRFRNRVRIVVPNCQDIDLVMWVFCLNNTFWSREDENGTEITFRAEMIRFVIARGLDLAERSHGILGNLIIITSSSNDIEARMYRIDLWTMSITTLVVIFSAPMPKSPGGVVVRASD